MAITIIQCPSCGLPPEEYIAKATGYLEPCGKYYLPDSSVSANFGIDIEASYNEGGECNAVWNYSLSYHPSSVSASYSSFPYTDCSFSNSHCAEFPVWFGFELNYGGGASAIESVTYSGEDCPEPGSNSYAIYSYGIECSLMICNPKPSGECDIYLTSYSSEAFADYGQGFIVWNYYDQPGVTMDNNVKINIAGATIDAQITGFFGYLHPWDSGTMTSKSVINIDLQKC